MCLCTFMVTHVLVHTNKSMRVHVFVYSFVSLVCLASICVRDMKDGLPAKTCLSNILSICESSSRLKADIKAVVRLWWALVQAWSSCSMHNCLLSLPAAELEHNLPIVSSSFFNISWFFFSNGVIKQKDISYLILHSYFFLSLPSPLTHFGYKTTKSFQLKPSWYLLWIFLYIWRLPMQNIIVISSNTLQLGIETT